MKYLLVSEEDLEKPGNLARLMWPQGREHYPGATYYVPADHANIAFIACRVDPVWRDLPLDSNRQVKIII